MDATNEAGKSIRKEITAALSKCLIKHIDPKHDQRIYWAREVTVDYGTTKCRRVDFMQFKPVNNSVSGIEKGDIFCYEIKSSVEDFHSRNGHNFIGDYNYYIMPEEVYTKVRHEIPYRVGVYVPSNANFVKSGGGLVSVKRAGRLDRTRPLSELLFLMMRSALRDMDLNKVI